MRRKEIRFPVDGLPYRSWSFPYEDDICVIYSISSRLSSLNDLETVELRGKLYDLEASILSTPCPRSILRVHAEKLIHLYRIARFGVPIDLLEMNCVEGPEDFPLETLMRGEDLVRPRRLNGYFIGDGSLDHTFGWTIEMHEPSKSDTFLSLALESAVIGPFQARDLLSKYKERMAPRWFSLIKVNSNGVIVNMHLAFRNPQVLGPYLPSNDAEIGPQHCFREPFIVKYPNQSLSEIDKYKAFPVTDMTNGSVSYFLS